jgi:hypothetical protein
MTKPNLPSPKKQNNLGAIFGGAIGGIAAIFAVVGIVTFVQRRRRRKRLPIFSVDFVDADPRMIVSPFNLNPFDANQASGIPAEQQPLVIGDPEAERVAFQHLPSSPPAELPLLRQVAPVPARLSDKEAARLRAEALSSPQPDNLQVALNTSQSTSLLNAVTKSGESPSDTRRLHSEFESLRREVERLREEGLVVAAPPSYTEGDG